VGPRAGLDRRLGGPQGRSVQEAGWAPGPVWTGAERLAPTGMDSCVALHKIMQQMADSSL
jgi:hypothetical protein